MVNLRFIVALFASMHISQSTAEETLRIKCNGTVSYSVTPFEFGGLSYNYLGDPIESGLKEVELFAVWKITEVGGHGLQMGQNNFPNPSVWNGTIWDGLHEGHYVDVGEDSLWAAKTCPGCWGNTIYNTLSFQIDRLTGYVDELKLDDVTLAWEPWQITEIELAGPKAMKCVKVNRAL